MTSDHTDWARALSYAKSKVLGISRSYQWDWPRRKKLPEWWKDVFSSISWCFWVSCAIFKCGLPSCLSLWPGIPADLFIMTSIREPLVIKYDSQLGSWKVEHQTVLFKSAAQWTNSFADKHYVVPDSANEWSVLANNKTSVIRCTSPVQLFQ